MKDNNLAKNRTAKILIILLVIGVPILAWFLLAPKNYAQEVVAPLEQSLRKEGAIKVANDNGYSLKQGSPQDRGWLGAVADVYIENWYFDTSNKNSPYSDLEAGDIKLAFKLGGEDNPDPENSTTVRLSVKLPSFKK